MAKLGNGMNDEELLKCLCQVVTSPDHFKGLYGYLERRNMVSGFLARGEMVVVREVIFETGLLETYDSGRCDRLYDAIALSLKEDRRERVAGLLEAVQERPAWRSEFDWFVNGFFVSYPPEKDGMPLKRFLTLYGEELSKRHPAIFEAICRELVGRLRWRLQFKDNLASQKLLADLVGQPSLLTPVAFVEGFLFYADDKNRINFVNYGYKEAIEEGLKKKYLGGGRKLWGFMVSKHPAQFFGYYPSTDEARTAAARNFKHSKQDREVEWAMENAPIFLPKLKAKLQESDISILLQTVLWSIIVEYATTGATWVDV